MVDVEYSGESVYVLRCSVGDTIGWYIGCTYSSTPWERISQHIGDDYDHNRFIDNHDIVGLEVVFKFGVEGESSYRDCVEKNESFLTKAMMCRYSPERVYGGGFSKKRTPAKEGGFTQPTIEFARDVRKTDWSWILKYSDRVRNSFYSSYSTVNDGKKIKWRVTQPALD